MEKHRQSPHQVSEVQLYSYPELECVLVLTCILTLKMWRSHFKKSNTFINSVLDQMQVVQLCYPNFQLYGNFHSLS